MKRSKMFLSTLVLTFISILSVLMIFAQTEQEDRDLQKEIEEATENLREQIKQAGEEIKTGMGESQANEEFYVILAPFRRTVLSNQISTPILSSQVSSQVQRIYKRMGEYFEKGDLLIKIDDTIFAANLEKSKVVLERALALLHTRTKLFQDKIVSYLDLKEAEAAAATAHAELVLAQTQYDGAFVTAPFRGRVIAVSIEEFELPQPGQPLIEIEQVDYLLAKVLFPSAYFRDLAIGKIFQVDVKETGTKVDAKIVRIGGAIDPSSSTLAVEAEVNNLEGLLMAGMTGKTNIGTLRAADNTIDVNSPTYKESEEKNTEEELKKKNQEDKESEEMLKKSDEKMKISDAEGDRLQSIIELHRDTLLEDYKCDCEVL